MDLKEYFDDKRATMEQLRKKYPNNLVHVTSKFYRERNSTEGATASANYANAARVITDGTHREATEAEIAKFYEQQQRELEKNTRSEQSKKQQYVIVTDNSSSLSNATVVPAQKGKPETAAPVKPAEKAEAQK